jgi:succinoglycan biosynthesis transport protein ExoP
MNNRPAQFENGSGKFPAPTAFASLDLPAKHYPHSNWAQVELSDLPASQDVLAYWRTLRVHKYLILRFTLLGLLIALVFSMFEKPSYRAHASIAIQDLHENFLNLKADPTALNSSETSESYFQTQIQILQSESLLERVIATPRIAQAIAKEQPESRWRSWRKYPGLREVPSPREPYHYVGNAASQLTVRSSAQTRLVQVFFEAGSPQLAADFTNTLVNEFIEQSHQMRWESTQRTAEWLGAHMKEMKANLETTEAELQAYARNSGLIFSERGNVAEEKLRQLQEEYSKAQVERAERQAKYEMAITKPVESLPETLDDPMLREYRLKLAELVRERAQLTTALMPEHYKVQRIQAQIDEVRSTLEAQRTNIVRRSANEYQSARRREELMALAYKQQTKVVAQQAEKTIHYETLKHEVDTSRQLYDALLQRVKQASLAAAMRASNILVVDTAKPPLLPYRPNYRLNCALGLLIGTLLGTGVSILRERFSRRIATPGVAPAYLNLPELGAIPSAASSSSVRGLLSAGNRSQGNKLRWTEGSNGENELCKASLSRGATEKSELAMMAEAFRATLTSILLPSLGDRPPRVIVLTSPRSGAGKTTVTSNLGIVMAEIGRRVLLVDGDLRSPRLHDVFQLSNSWGLCDVLRSSNPIDKCGLLQIVRHTDVPGLDLLPSGACRESPSQMLYSPRVAELLRRVEEEYDLVLVDSPPMMQLADARVLGRIADGVVLVIRSGHTTLGLAQLAVQRFAEDGTRVLGTVLNSWDPRSSEGTDYTYSYREYAHQYHSQPANPLKAKAGVAFTQLFSSAKR